MEARLAKLFFPMVALSASICSAETAPRKEYTPAQYLKNYALSACIADGYHAKEAVADATAGANGYKELGSLDIDAYNEALALSKKFLAQHYASQNGSELIVMKCIDFFHSDELDRLAKKYADKQ